MTELPALPSRELPQRVRRWQDDAKRWATMSQAPNSRRAYRSDWQRFERWCTEVGRAPLPAAPETLAEYIAYLAGERGYQISSIDRALATIAKAHRLAEQESPTSDARVRAVLSGLRRERGRKRRQARPITLHELQRMVAALPGGTLREQRDRALLTVGWVGAFRRSELTALEVEHLEWTDEGAIATLPRSKTDQEGQGLTKLIPFSSLASGGFVNPAAELRKWIDRAAIEEGPVLRGVDRHGNLRPEERLSDQAVRLIVRRAAKAAGVAQEGLTAHSLRAGLVTEAEVQRVPRAIVLGQTGWSSERMFATYSRPDYSEGFQRLRLLVGDGI